MRSTLLSLVAALPAALGLASVGNAQGSGFEIGRPVPNLEFPTIDGAETVRLSELRGRALLLIQFASW